MHNAEMDLDAVAVFVKVVQAGSFTRAAQLLGMPNSTVSAKVATLEAHLGLTLLQRTTRRLSVTDAGSAFYAKAAKGLEAIQDAEAEAAQSRGEPSGLLRVTAPIDAGHAILPHVVRRFLEAYPSLNVECWITNRRVDMIAEGVDLALRGGALQDSSLIAKKASLGASGVWASPAYLKARGSPARPKDLERHECIRFLPSGGRGWDLTNGKDRVSIKPRGRIAVDDFEGAKEFARAGLGLCLAPRFLCVEDEERGRLARVLPAWQWALPAFYFVYPAQRFVPPKVKAFIAVAEKTLAEICRE